jgi:hypothetical protein
MPSIPMRFSLRGSTKVYRWLGIAVLAVATQITLLPTASAGGQEFPGTARSRAHDAGEYDG